MLLGFSLVFGLLFFLPHANMALSDFLGWMLSGESKDDQEDMYKNQEGSNHEDFSEKALQCH